MKVTSKEPCCAVELERGETLTVASTYESIKRQYDLSALRSVELKVYDGFFVVRFVDKGGKAKEHAYSDTWDFSVR
jgi:hypothetical protein